MGGKRCVVCGGTRAGEKRIRWPGEPACRRMRLFSALSAPEEGMMRRRLEMLCRSVHPVLPCSRVSLAAGASGRRCSPGEMGTAAFVPAHDVGGRGPGRFDDAIAGGVGHFFRILPPGVGPESAGGMRRASCRVPRMGRPALRRDAGDGRHTARVCPARVAFPATAWRPPRRAGLCRRVCAALPIPPPAGAVAGATAWSVAG